MLRILVPKKSLTAFHFVHIETAPRLPVTCQLQLRQECPSAPSLIAAREAC
jgi:hypothetical protein